MTGTPTRPLALEPNLASQPGGAASLTERQCGLYFDHHVEPVALISGHRLAYVNDALARLLGWDRADLVSRALEDVFGHRTAEHLIWCGYDPIVGTLSAPLNLRVENRHGEAFDLEVHSRTVSFHEAPAALLTLHDATDRQLQRAAYEELTSQFHSLVAGAPVGIYIIQDRRFVYVNERMCQIYGYTREEFFGFASVLDLVVEEDRELALDNVRRRERQEVVHVHYTMRQRRKSGRVIHVEIYGGVTQYEGQPAVIGTVTDISEQVEAQNRLASLVTHDPLTGLLNRRGLEEALGIENERHRRTGASMAGVLIDCDCFKQVNEGFGYTHGDAVLVEIGRRIAHAVRPTDHVGRIGGDEFLVLLPEVAQSHALQLAERIRNAIRRDRMRVGPAHISVTVSAGVCVVPRDATLDVVVQESESGLRYSKNAGRDTVSLA